MKSTSLWFARSAAFPLSNAAAGALIFAIAAVSSAVMAATNPLRGRPGTVVTKPVSFEMLDDYNKGQDLRGIALDFRLMNQLGIDTLRCSFGWDDYEPTRGKYDFTWLKQFVALADQYGIKLRPYIGYTAPWAGRGGRDDIYWNDPPALQKDWYDFVYNLAFALRDNHNVLSYEIYNEENDSFWWEGKPGRYRETLRQAALAVRAADPNAQVILGGFVFPDYDWLSSIVDAGYSDYYDVTAFHAYPETFEDSAVELYLDVQYYDYFVPLNNMHGGHKPIWINEMGYATSPGITEQQQARWYARAVSTFLADPNIQELGFFEIRDLRPQDPAIGGEATYHLGLTYPDRTKKLAFSTVQMLMGLLNKGNLAVADDEATVTVTSGQAGELYSHLFKRPDGKQVLFVYDKTSNPTVQVNLQTRGSAAYLYDLDGTSSAYRAFDGLKLQSVALNPGSVAVFRIDP